jgi:hypothetical protein
VNHRSIAAAVVIALTCAAGGIAYVWVREPLPASATGESDALLWLRREFKLSADTLARIEKMHADHQVVCEEHCRDIQDARRALRRLRQTQASAEELAAAEARLAEVNLVCTTSLEAHMRQIARVMGGEQGERYLSIVLPRVAQYDHAGAPALDFKNAPPHAGHTPP